MKLQFCIISRLHFLTDVFALTTIIHIEYDTVKFNTYNLRILLNGIPSAGFPNASKPLFYPFYTERHLTFTLDDKSLLVCFPALNN